MIKYTSCNIFVKTEFHFDQEFLRYPSEDHDIIWVITSMLSVLQWQHWLPASDISINTTNASSNVPHLGVSPLLSTSCRISSDNRNAMPVRNWILNKKYTVLTIAYLILLVVCVSHMKRQYEVTGCHLGTLDVTASALKARKKLIFVGVMTAKETRNSRAKAAAETWARSIPGDVRFFCGPSCQVRVTPQVCWGFNKPVHWDESF